ncbi:MAG: YCF48-related protein [Halioglobus sp.]
MIIATTKNEVEDLLLPQRMAIGLLLTLAVTMTAVLDANATQYAPLMPLASRSLLLDITGAGDRIVVVGERGHILYSDDNGSSWLQARVPTTQMLTGVFFIDQQRGWAVGHDGLILVSDDGAVSWRIQRDGIAAQHQANLEKREQVHRQIGNLKLAIASAGAEGLPQLETQLEELVMDLEDADLALEEDVFTSPLMAVWFQDHNRGWAVGAFGAVVVTTDGGNHWAARQDLLDNPDEFHLNTITGDGAGRVFIAGEGGVMYRSMDNGQSWGSIDSVYEGSWFGAIFSEKQQTLLVFGLRGNLFRSTNFGDTWEPIANNTHITLAGGTVAANGDIALAGGAGTLMLSKDGGASFQSSVVPDRLGLSSAMVSNGRLIVIGQGGTRVRAYGH